MADRKITDLAPLTDPADSDVLAAVDVSDPSMALSGTTKKLPLDTMGTYVELRTKVLASFDYTASSPIDFGSLPAGRAIVDAQVIIDVPFDDPATLISLGTVAAPDTLLPTNTIDPDVAGTYKTDENVLIGTTTAGRLKVLPGASTQGTGRVVIILV